MEKITKESLFEMKSLAQPICAGELVFYLECSINKEKNRYESQIYSYHMKTKERIQWGDGGTSANNLQLSPDGLYLSFLSNHNEEEKNQIMLMPIQGGKAFQLTNEKETISSYDWSEDSKTIYYQTTEKIEEKEKSELPEAVTLTKLSYQSDGSGLIPENIVYQAKKITLISRETTLLLEKVEPFKLDKVSSDETYLLFSDDLDTEDEWVYGGTVYYYDCVSKEEYSLTSSIPQGSFSFEKMIGNEGCLLTGNDFSYAFVTQNKLYYYEFASRELKCLTPFLDKEISDGLVGDFQQKNRGLSVLLLDDTSFIFPVTEEGKITLYKGDLSGQNDCVFNQPVHLTDGDKFDQDNLVVTYSTTTLPSGLGILNLITGEITEIYNPNEQFLEETMISQPEMFWYKGVKGWDIQGWYLPPVEKKEEHPAILYIHGGPQVCYGETFFHEMQVHAANGYGVIMLNPRGGQGYGQEFVAAILGDYGNEDYQDLMLGTDVVLANHPEIDSASVYVAGGSYGGFMTNWIVGYTSRFKAAVTQRSISNWISFYGTSDIGPFFVQCQLQRDIDDVEGLWHMSPLAHAGKAQTPILILHGQEDLRCPLEQGQQFYIAMKRQRIDTKMIQFPKSSHSLSRTGLPNLRMTRIQAIEDWFAEH